MNNKWTRVNRVAVIVSFCISIVACLILLVLSIGGPMSAGFIWVSIGGMASAVISHLIWALYIEMSENLARLSSRNTAAMENTLNDISWTLGRILENMSNGATPKSDTPWKCTCGRVNPADANFCQSCGSVRGNHIPDVKQGGIL